MIESISMQGVASFSELTPVTINTNKKLVVIYGHNGTGKSTLARYLQNTSDSNYNRCNFTLPNSQDYQLLVYNTDFVEKNFSQDSFEGVFTLGEENVAAEQAITVAEQEITSLEGQRHQKQQAKSECGTRKETKIRHIKNKVYEIKKEHDRKDLDHCLVGFKNSADKFYEALLRTPLLNSPGYDFNDLARESSELNRKTAEKRSLLPTLSSNLSAIETNSIFNEVIIASRESYLSNLVEKLKNSSWIDQGRIYINDAEGKCPFCQQALGDELAKQINSLFDSSYEQKKKEIQGLRDSYFNKANELKTQLSENHFKLLNNRDLDLQKERLINSLEANLEKIDKKLNDPSIRVSLKETDDFLQSINQIVEDENSSRRTFNSKLEKKKDSLDEIKSKFWSLVRIKFDSEIKKHDKLIEEINSEILKYEDEIAALTRSIEEQNEIISENRAKITNIDTSITNINSQIISIGLEGFEIKRKPGEDNHYYLCRGTHNSGNHVYKSLSEGEKTLITYLYFLELCQGSIRFDSPTPKNKKIIVVDDPISSLSHNYIYEIGSLTHKKIIKGYEYSQVILLTHSLYFLHEMIKYLPKKQEDFDKKCNVFRVTKNTHSNISPMKRGDIKNDYQSYWQIIKDAQEGNTNNIVLPNIMRNILEYYFSFVHKTDELKKALEELEEDDAEFSSFFRFINRESHSDSVNINDLGEIDSDRFINKFREVFLRTNFEEHYNKMMS
ncbi:AAA family ATPase [Halomonas sp. RT37]|uniref:AAA family ATPase n=1 Tax=Halomonas sp. RT37 TaxID=2950872 RepID=A0AAU7KG06_9GAMM